MFFKYPVFISIFVLVLVLLVSSIYVMVLQLLLLFLYDAKLSLNLFLLNNTCIFLVRLVFVEGPICLLTFTFHNKKTFTFIWFDFLSSFLLDCKLFFMFVS
jgi:hypothetical protein